MRLLGETPGLLRRERQELRREQEQARAYQQAPTLILERTAAKMDNYEPDFGPRNRMLSFISEGRESEFDDDTIALDDSGRSSNNGGIRASVFMRGDSMLEAVQEDDSMRDGSVFSASSRARSVRSAASSGSRRSRSNLSHSVTSYSSSYSKSLRSSIQSTGTSCTHASMSSASSPLVFTQHSLKQVSTREINIHETPYWAGMDESLPEEYSDASLYDHELILPPKEKEDSVVSSEEEDDYRMLSPEYKWGDTKLLTSQRKMYALVTVLGAITLCIVGIIVAAQVLGTNSSMSHTPNFNAEFFYLPRYEFGGGSGGISGIRDDGVRRVEDSTYYDIFSAAATGDNTAEQYLPPSSSTLDAPKLVLAPTADANPSNVKLVANTRSSLQSLRAAQDPFGGFGPRQFNPIYDGHHRPQDKKMLTSSALSSYTPPEEENGLTIVLDPMFNGAMIDVSVLPVNPDREMPVFWDVPMSAVPRIQYVLGHCLKLVQCTETGKYLLIRDIPASFDPPLKIESVQSLKYVNVDCSTPHGIARGVSHNLATSKMIDAVYTPEIHDAARLFAPPIQAYGRGLVMMRHPVERICALYEYLRLNGDDSKVKGLSLQDYANSDLLQDNPLTRSLSGSKHGTLQVSDLEVAKEILKRKFIIGLYENIQESIERFELFFGWQLDAEARTCQYDELQREELAHYNRYAKDIGSNKESHPGLTSRALEGIMSKNRMDLLLYDYSRFLFDYQGKVLFDMEKRVTR